MIEFVFVVDALHAGEVPVGDGGVFDERRLLFGDGFVVTEVFLEHGHERFGIFAGDEELFGGCAVFQAVETGLGRRGIEGFRVRFGQRRG